MLRNQILIIKNIFASRFTFGVSRFIFRRAACNLWRAAICTILFLFTFWVSSFAQDKIVAIVNNDIITQKDLNDFISFMRVQLFTEYKGGQLENKIQSMKLDLLNKLIEDRLILQEAKKSNIRIGQDRIKARIDEIKRQYPAERDFQNALAQQGFVQADIESKIKEQLLMHTIIEIKIKSKIVISPSEVTDFYQENIEKFILPEQREFESLTIADENTAKGISESLKRGEKLEETANKYSLLINKFSALRGGQLKKDIEEEVFKLNSGEISLPIKIQNNYYIFKLNNIIAPHQQNLSEAQDSIYAFLSDKKIQEALMRWLDELRAQSYIKIMQE